MKLKIRQKQQKLRFQKFTWRSFGLQNMNLQLHFAQKIIKKSLKLAEIDLFHSN